MVGHPAFCCMLPLYFYCGRYIGETLVWPFVPCCPVVTRRGLRRRFRTGNRGAGAHAKLRDVRASAVSTGTPAPDATERPSRRAPDPGSTPAVASTVPTPTGTPALGVTPEFTPSPTAGPATTLPASPEPGPSPTPTADDQEASRLLESAAQNMQGMGLAFDMDIQLRAQQGGSTDAFTIVHGSYAGDFHAGT